MKKNRHTSLVNKTRLTAFTALLLATGFNVQAQVIADWDVTGLSGFGPSPMAPTTTTAYLTYGGLTRGPDVTTAGTPVGDGWGGDGWTNMPGSDISFSLTADAGYMLSIDSIDMSFMRNASGPAGGPLEYSINGGPYTLAYYLGFVTTDPGGSGLPTLDMTFISDLQNIPAGSTLTFRIIPDPTMATGSNGPLFIYNSPWGYHGCKGIRVFGKVEPSCAIPTLSFGTITDEDATINWTSSPGALGYEYAYESTLDPPTDWTYTTATSVTLSGLDAGTQYYFYIRAICPAGDTSTYTGGGFITQDHTGIFSQQAAGQINVYPNPLDRELVVETGNSTNGTGIIVITDMAGKIHQTVAATTSKTVIPVTAMAPGVYLVRYTCEKETCSSLVVKQ